MFTYYVYMCVPFLIKVVGIVFMNVVVSETSETAMNGIIKEIAAYVRLPRPVSGIWPSHLTLGITVHDKIAKKNIRLHYKLFPLTLLVTNEEMLSFCSAQLFYKRSLE